MDRRAAVLRISSTWKDGEKLQLQGDHHLCTHVLWESLMILQQMLPALHRCVKGLVNISER